MFQIFMDWAILIALYIIMKQQNIRMKRYKKQE
jgi:hypothetical protein